MKKFIKDIVNRFKTRGLKSVIIGTGANIADSSFEAYNAVGQDTWFVASKMGVGSYIGANCYLSRTSVGKFCSLGSNIRLAVGNHPVKDWVSTHPAFFSTAGQSGFAFVKENLFEEKVYVDINAGVYLSIGNDVWIGDNVTIIPGHQIGDGSIIAAGSVITKDVEPYAIVGGNPAKVIRYRFPGEDIAFLKSLQWWNKDYNWIKSHAALFSDITKLKDSIDESINNSSE